MWIEFCISRHLFKNFFNALQSAVQKSDGFSSLALPKRIMRKAPWQFNPDSLCKMRIKIRDSRGE